MKITRPFRIKSALTAASLAVVVTLASHPAPARAEARDVPKPVSPFTSRVAEPSDVRTSITAVRAACSAWPRVVNAPLAVPQTGGPDMAAISDGNLCDFIDNPESVTWSVGMFAAILTTIGFVVAAAVIGLLRMILIAAWSWRPRRNIVPWA
ncbi:hypothetical protein HN018_23405 (plasmid) [Lichenicola cladoniae]|uniref:Uncharacterized protein n=1 Tax=Lichenicola cladoniae TaxID=1484109 RepID=A0A6M8HX90_9PROT|nr:hypothetical protein [Lichenicola cladoniae]NPD66333.1 hypothetical protein [Acetobacteraceae bacterium]QKE93133.1 hypothetical protein HN018_23405 [Lichenicola cladoniae]